VRLSDGEGFVDEQTTAQLEARSAEALEALLEQQRITNLHLAELTGINYSTEDLE
jgi:hypothetical protein